MIIVHHLNFSRSTRVLWLLEELALPYQIRFHQRTPGFRAPDGLKAVHPLGKAPVMIDGDVTLAESAVILTYLNDRHGQGRLAPPPGTIERTRHDEWLHFVESSAAFPVALGFYGGLTGGLSPVLGRIAEREQRNGFDHIARALDGKPYLMGQDFTLADIQLAYLLDLARYAGQLAAYPALIDYLARLQARGPYAAAVAKGGPMVPPRN